MEGRHGGRKKGNKRRDRQKGWKERTAKKTEGTLQENNIVDVFYKK